MFSRKAKNALAVTSICANDDGTSPSLYLYYNIFLIYGSLIPGAFIKRHDGERVKFAADAIDVDKGQSASMGAIGEEDKNSLPRSINPAACAGEA